MNAILINFFFQLSLRSLDPSFGLLFGDLLKELKVDSVGASVIMSILDSVMNFSGKTNSIIISVEQIVNVPT